jgi:hypothetical protein
MRMITYSDEAAPCSRSNHLMGTGLLPSSDGSDNSFSRTLLQKLWTEMMVNQAIPVSVSGPVYTYLSSLASNLLSI